MIRRARIAVATACLGALFQIAAAGLPSRERARNDVQDRWRTGIDRAEEARSEGRLDEAEALYRGILDEAGEIDRPHLLLARAIDGMGDICRVQQRHDEAVAYYARAAEMWEPLLGKDQPRLALTLHNLGTVYLAQEKLDEAGSAFGRALEIWEIALGPDSAEARTTRDAAAVLESRRRQRDSAGAELDR